MIGQKSFKDHLIQKSNGAVDSGISIDSFGRSLFIGLLVKSIEALFR